MTNKNTFNKKTLVRNYKMYLPTKFQTQNKGVKAFNIKMYFLAMWLKISFTYKNK